MKNIATIWLLIILFSALMSVGCASISKDISHTKNLVIKRVGTQWTTISAVSVVQEGNKTKVRGEVRRRTHSRGPIGGHTDIKVVGPEGTILEEQSVKHHKKSIKARHADFVFELKTEPPMGSVIQITHHAPLSTGQF